MHGGTVMLASSVQFALLHKIATEVHHKAKLMTSNNVSAAYAASCLARSSKAFKSTLMHGTCLALRCAHDHSVLPFPHSVSASFVYIYSTFLARMQFCIHIGGECFTS